MSHHANFFFLEKEFQHVEQAGLEQSDLPTSASQSARIIGVSHRTWPEHYLHVESKGQDWWVSGFTVPLTSYVFFFLLLIFEMGLTLIPRLECSGTVMDTSTSTSQAQAILPCHQPK